VVADEAKLETVAVSPKVTEKNPQPGDLVRGFQLNTLEGNLAETDNSTSLLLILLSSETLLTRKWKFVTFYFCPVRHHPMGRSDMFKSSRKKERGARYYYCQSCGRSYQLTQLIKERQSLGARTRRAKPKFPIYKTPRRWKPVLG
jgi:hypothetical protein